MTPPTLTFHGRLPGVACDPALPGVEQPIRLDVAAFVGFAERGPVDQPVVLSDALGFTAVFGGDHVLADDGGRPVYAHLPAAVRAFFDNGGVRCYAVRVGGADPMPSRWAVTGLQIWQPDNTVDDVVVEAAWPGRWSVGTRGSVEPVARPWPSARRTNAAARTPGSWCCREERSRACNRVTCWNWTSEPANPASTSGPGRHRSASCSPTTS